MIKDADIRTRKRLALGLVFLAGWLCARPAFSSPSRDPAGLKKALDGFHAFYAEGMAKAGIVGGSILILHDNQLVDKVHFGLADLEKSRPADDHTIYHWASITKTLTGIAIMQLRDRGLLRLDDPIVKYVPELRQVHDPFGDISEVTIRHLLTHSAGFRSATWPWRDADWQPFEPRRWEPLAAMLPYTQIEFKPGSRQSYSNPGIIFLGRTIELLTGDDFEVAIDKNILRPLDMRESYFDATPYHLLKNRARSYSREGGVLTPAPFDADTGITVSNGGFNAPLADFAKYLDFLMGNPAKQDAYEGILKRSSLEEMFQPVIRIEPESPAAAGAEPAEASQGLIFFVERHFGTTYIGHSGHQNAFVSHFYLQPASRTAYVVAYNTYATPKEGAPAETAFGTDRLDREIRSYLFKNVFPLFDGKR
ncbi:MAG: serine hydrolase [Acidobacteriota bacterium]|nr:serine hydrolase [Acidobacteriota bacterium]